MSKKPPTNAFQEAMQQVRRLHTDKLPQETPSPPLPPKRASRSPQADSLDLSPVLAFSIPEIVHPIPKLCNQGAQPKQFKALQKGELSTEHVLDVHGMTLATAAEQVPCWLSHCQQQGMRVVRLIHGQGRNPLKPSVKQLIREGLLHIPHLVLAFCEAPVSQGSTGATLVLLRRSC